MRARSPRVRRKTWPNGCPSPNPEKVPEARPHRLVTVDATRRDEALAKAEVRPDDVLEAPRKRGEPENAPPRFDLKLRLEDRPETAKAIDEWIAGPWTHWAAEEIPRRRTIKLYQQLYKVFQLFEVGAAESSIELMWGIGSTNWQKSQQVLDRPLIKGASRSNSTTHAAASSAFGQPPPFPSST